MKRYRRLRMTKALRDLVRETTLSGDDLVQPFFVIEGKKREDPIDSMPGICRYSVDLLVKAIDKYIKAGGAAGLFFGIPSVKDALAIRAYAKDGVVQNAIRAVKKEFPEFLVMTDVCLCSYTDHGHCGVVSGRDVDNDRTVSLLVQTALSHARSGCDIVAPSDMMDGRVLKIREELDRNDCTDVGIMSYAVKYASAFYGPFREAADSKPQFGDRKTYQMDCANIREALKEAQQDAREGADIVMVKPALAYLDVIALLRAKLTVPIAAYSVSGEYSMVKAAAAKDWIDEKAVVLETLTSIKRAGADIIITYHAQDALRWMAEVRGKR